LKVDGDDMKMKKMRQLW